MKYRYIEARIRLSELNTRPVCVREWELPILQAMHGENVQATGERVVSVKAPIDPQDEFSRLATRYGQPNPGATPYVAAVYGAFGPGVVGLGKAIKAAEIQDEAPLISDESEEDFSALLDETA